jgi:hypothetical protein
MSTRGCRYGRPALDSTPRFLACCRYAKQDSVMERSERWRNTNRSRLRNRGSVRAVGCSGPRALAKRRARIAVPVAGTRRSDAPACRNRSSRSLTCRRYGRTSAGCVGGSIPSPAAGAVRWLEWSSIRDQRRGTAARSAGARRDGIWRRNGCGGCAPAGSRKHLVRPLGHQHRAGSTHEAVRAQRYRNNDGSTRRTLRPLSNRNNGTSKQNVLRVPSHRHTGDHLPTGFDRWTAPLEMWMEDPPLRGPRPRAVRVSFAPTRLADEQLAAAYDQLLPQVHRARGVPAADAQPPVLPAQAPREQEQA